MAKKYRTHKYNLGIDAVEVERESASSVWFKEKDWTGNLRMKREGKVGLYNRFHDSYAEAKAFLVDRAKNRVEELERNLGKAKIELTRAESLREQVTMAAELNQPASPIQSIQESPEILEQDVAK